jgi:hypothetical protein
MLKRYGDKALEESAARAHELATAGNGVATWRRITAAVTETRQPNPARPGSLTALLST